MALQRCGWSCPMDSELDRILDPHFLDDHETFDVERLRDMRERCRRVETSLSYLRRLAQGRIDIVDAELSRRADGGDPADVDDLVGRLPEAMSEHSASDHAGPMPRSLAPGRIDGALAEELAGMEVESRLNEPAEVTDDWLRSTRERLGDYERRVSELRRVLFERIDTLGSDLVRRYRDGDGDIDAIIGGS